jgi:hypothetical protein
MLLWRAIDPVAGPATATVGKSGDARAQQALPIPIDVFLLTLLAAIGYPFPLQRWEGSAF